MSEHIQYDNTSAANINDLIRDERAQVNREWKLKIFYGTVIIVLLTLLLFVATNVDEYVSYKRINEIRYTKDSLYVTVGNKTFVSGRPKN